jgi:hypothetical protein
MAYAPPRNLILDFRGADIDTADTLAVTDEHMEALMRTLSGDDCAVPPTPTSAADDGPVERPNAPTSAADDGPVALPGAPPAGDEATSGTATPLAAAIPIPDMLAALAAVIMCIRPEVLPSIAPPSPPLVLMVFEGVHIILLGCSIRQILTTTQLVLLRLLTLRVRQPNATNIV